MWFLPFLFLTKQGRLDIGVKKPHHPLWLLWGVLIGLGISFLYFLLGFGLYGRTIDNWFVNIGTQFLPANTASWGLSRFELFVILTTPAIVFSPIGEEFFFRGMIHAMIEHKSNATVATILNALAFSGIHLLHHGVFLTATGIQILWVPGLLFFLLMVLLSWILTVCRTRSGSLWPAVICHAAFNLMMNLTLFLFLM
jgi:membrane protease YdiL (CAAX protease family)